MEVCEVCGAFLIVGDAQQRIDDHLMGKQHVGYARLKTAVDEMSKVCVLLRLIYGATTGQVAPRMPHRISTYWFFSRIQTQHIFIEKYSDTIGFLKN